MVKQYKYLNGSNNNGGYGKNSVLNNFNSRFANNKPTQFHAEIENFANRAQKDPWFALGEVLGGSWASNYKQRGINKLLDQYESEISPTATPKEEEQALNIVAGQNDSNAEQDLALNNGSKFGEFNYLPYDKKLEIAEQYSPKNLANITGLGVPTTDGGDKLFKTQEQQDVDKSVLSRLGYIPSTVSDQSIQAMENGAGQLRTINDSKGNVIGLEAQPSTDAYTQYAVNNRLANIDPNQWLNSKILDMKKKGYSQADIQENLMPLAEQAQAIQDSRDEQMTNAYTNMYMEALNKGDYNAANYYSMLMYKHNPNMASYMLNSGVTPYAQYNNREKARLTDEQFAQRQALAKYRSDLNAQNGVGASNRGSGISTNQLNAAKEVLAQAKAWDEAHSGEEGVVNPYTEQVDYARKILSAAMGVQEKDSSEQKRTPQPVDYPTLVRQIAIYKKDHNGKFDTEGLRQLREYYGIDPDNDNPEDTLNSYIKSIIGNIG